MVDCAAQDTREALWGLRVARLSTVWAATNLPLAMTASVWDTQVDMPMRSVTRYSMVDHLSKSQFHHEPLGRSLPPSLFKAVAIIILASSVVEPSHL